MFPALERSDWLLVQFSALKMSDKCSPSENTALGMGLTPSSRLITGSNLGQVCRTAGNDDISRSAKSR